MDVRFVFLLAALGFVQSKLSCSIIKKIVDGHNSRRLLIAQGNVPNQPPASKMNMMVWDEQLAEKAAAWASNNNFTHNPNRYIDSPNFSSTGENLYQYSTTAPKLNFDPEMALTPWFDEYEDFTFKPLAWEDFGKSPPVGHYTQMVWSDTTYVGCGMSRFKQGSWINILFVCNYGPTQLTVENLRFLNVDQALADLARFIGELKKVPRFAESKVILYGGSYAANMVLWFKQRYPHLVTGGVASSGPIKGEIDFTGYLEVVYEAFLSEGGEQCIDHIKRGIDATIEALKTEEGREIIDDAFRLCKPRTFDFDDRFDLGYFSGLISWSFSSSVQTAFPGSLRTICNNFANNAYGSTPMAQLGGYIASVQRLDETSCWALSYESYIASLSQLVPTVSRAWYYQTCLEYGYFQTAPRSGTPFDVLQWLSVEWYVDVCKRAFDERFDEQFVRNAIERTNTFFGGLEPDVNNTINIHGAIDPWKALGVLDKDLKESSPTFYVPRASHCFDMRSWGITDTIQMTGVQQRARRIVASWLSDETD